MAKEEKPITEQDWREVPGSEMLTRVIVAVDAGRLEALEHGEEHYVRYCDAQLFPFLEAEQEKARLMLRDDNLWILPPDIRYGSELDGEAGVWEWEPIAHLADSLAELATNSIDRRSHAAYL